MKMNWLCMFVVSLIGGILAGQMVVKADLSNQLDKAKDQAIANECARYSPTTGEFEWLGAGDG